MVAHDDLFLFSQLAYIHVFLPSVFPKDCRASLAKSGAVYLSPPPIIEYLGHPECSTIANTYASELNLQVRTSLASHIPMSVFFWGFFYSKLEVLSTSALLLASAEEAVELHNTEAMKRPKKFSHPSIQTGLAVAMTTPLHIIVKSSLSKTIVACLGGQERKKRVRM